MTDPDWIDVPIYRERVREDSLYADILNRCRMPVTSYDRDTNAHETTHMLQAELRNLHVPAKPVNCFYVGGGRAALVDEPRLLISDIAPLVPPCLRDYRFQTYLIDQQQWWNDRPLYLWDEWTAYVNGGAVSVQDYSVSGNVNVPTHFQRLWGRSEWSADDRGVRYTPPMRFARRHTRIYPSRILGGGTVDWTDAVSGCIGFSVYAVAVALAAIKAGVPWAFDDQRHRFLVWNLRRSYDTFMDGREAFFWDKQEAIWGALRGHPDAKEYRDFLLEHCEGLWMEGMWI